uniref:Uncharacterized protein n=1 Tax=viral metagenome TaxID=1070528 RepID=A0A6H1ZHE0_9ZZZZ
MINQSQKEVLQIILTNEVLFNAVKQVFDETIQKSKPKIGDMNDDNVVGQKYRAYMMAQELVNGGFNNLMSYMINKKDQPSFDKSQ